MLAKKFLDARRARYIPVRDVLARIVSELNCTEAEAAAVLCAALDDAGESAPAWFDIEGLESGAVAVKLNTRDGLAMLEAFNLPVFTYDPRVTLAELHDRYRAGELDYVDYMDGRLRSLPYEVGCFLVAEIEPVLLALIAAARSLSETPPALAAAAGAAASVADVSSSIISARDSNDDVVSLSPGRNDRAIVEAWVASQARVLFAAGDNKESLAAKIVNQIPYRAVSERGPITVPSVLRMMPAGITGGRSKNGRK